MIAKLHLRKNKDGHFFIQGVIPADQAEELGVDYPNYNDMLAVVDVNLVEVHDRTKQYAGLRNDTIRMEGFK